ncbi:MAG: TldD/PmbA family protein [Thermodesulfovibrionales bacterium]|nr:TldD/PmbA family protein [Thermodesulfovibrionales bacterium]
MKTDSGFPERLIGLALKNGVSHAEVFQKTSRRLSVEVKGRELEAVESSLSFGYSLRVIRDGRLGFSYSTDPAEFEKVVEAAAGSAKWTEKDLFLDLPEPSGYGMPEIYDPLVESIVRNPEKKDEAVEKALLIEKSAMKDSRIKRLRKATASFSSSETLIHNSKGIAAGYKATSCTAQVMAVAEDRGDSRMGWDFQGARFLSDISFEKVGSTASMRALRLLGARKTTAVKSPVLIENAVAVEFLGIFALLLSSDAVQKGKSLLKGRLGQKIISERINIIDDGLMPGKLGSIPVDDEGVSAGRKCLVEKGVLQGYMYNTYTARKDNVRSTGNAIRGGFSGIPSVGPTNLYIEPAETVSDLTGALGTGLFITEAMGMHTANPISGDFSVGVSGLWVEGGEIKFPVKEAVISGNILGFFKGILAAGDDLVFYGNIGSPGLVVGPVDISA